MLRRRNEYRSTIGCIKSRTAYRATHALIVLCLLAISSQLMAAPADRIIQNEQQRAEQERRRLEDQQRNRIQLPEGTSSKPIPLSSGGHCFEVSSITIQGLEVFDRSHFTQALAPFIDECLDSDDLNNVLNAITREYFDAGHITSKAYLPVQNLQSGELVIQVIEGRIESIKSGVGSSSESLSVVFPRLAGRALNLRDLEQGLEQINRLASFRATMQLLPGDIAGASVVEIQEQQQAPWQVNTKIDNSGQRSTGEIQQQLFLSWDSPLGLYDYSYLSLQSDLKDDSDGQKSQSLNWHWDMPLGYWSISADINYFKYLSEVTGNSLRFDTSGASASQSLALNRVVHRDGDSKTKVGVSLTRKKTENFVEDVLIETSSRVLSIAELNIHHTQYLSDGAVLLAELTYSRGLNWFDSPEDDNIDSILRSESPKAQFDRYTASVDYQQPFSIAGIAAQYRARIVGQYSPDVLFGTEMFSIGSTYTVRGYKEAGLSSNRGAYWRNDVLFSIQPKWGGGWLTRFSPFVGLDAGFVRDERLYTEKYEMLQGWALGVNLSGTNWTSSLTFSQPIDEPDYLQGTGDEFEFNVSVNF